MKFLTFWLWAAFVSAVCAVTALAVIATAVAILRLIFR